MMEVGDDVALGLSSRVQVVELGSYPEVADVETPI
jgi:hypothetical protein